MDLIVLLDCCSCVLYFCIVIMETITTIITATVLLHVLPHCNYKITKSERAAVVRKTLFLSCCFSVFTLPCIFKVAEFKNPHGSESSRHITAHQMTMESLNSGRQKKNTQIAVTGIFHDSSNLILFFLLLLG